MCKSLRKYRGFDVSGRLCIFAVNANEMLNVVFIYRIFCFISSSKCRNVQSNPALFDVGWHRR